MYTNVSIPAELMPYMKILIIILAIVTLVVIIKIANIILSIISIVMTLAIAGTVLLQNEGKLFIPKSSSDIPKAIEIVENNITNKANVIKEYTDKMREGSK